MRTSDFTFDLPEQLIAKMPLATRSASRLLCLEGDTGHCHHQKFTDLTSWLKPGDLLVFNDTKVMAARLFGRKESGGKVELLIERIVSSHHGLAHIKASKSPKPGTRIQLDNQQWLTVTGRQGELFELESSDDLYEVLADTGHIPLPPYIDREDTLADRERYQTVYSRNLGAVAAPTAGLHFDEPLLAALHKMGVEQTFVTLHVGAGTFQPVRVDDVNNHLMHSEVMTLTGDAASTINQAKREGRRVIAVGTTSVRCLETAALKGSAGGVLEPYQGETDIFIYPGFEYQILDGLITNFHLPESTLLMLVSAFAGYQHTIDAYKKAVDAEYRFFSYGDAMFITPNANAIKEAALQWPELTQQEPTQ